MITQFLILEPHDSFYKLIVEIKKYPEVPKYKRLTQRRAISLLNIESVQLKNMDGITLSGHDLCITSSHIPRLYYILLITIITHCTEETITDFLPSITRAIQEIETILVDLTIFHPTLQGYSDAPRS